MDKPKATTTLASLTSEVDDVETLAHDCRLYAVVARSLLEDTIKRKPEDPEGYSYPLSREERDMLAFAVNNVECAAIRLQRHLGFGREA